MSKTLLLLANGFEIYEASAFIDILGWNFVDGDGTTELVTCALQKQVRSTFDMTVTVDKTIDEISVDDFDALAIPGGFEEYSFYRDAYDEKFQRTIRNFHSGGKIIASICVAALPLGKSGILKGKKATTYNGNNGIRQKTLSGFGARVVDEPVVVDKNVITSRNPSTAVDVGFKLLERLTSRKQANYIRKIMGFWRQGRPPAKPSPPVRRLTKSRT